MAKAKTKKNEKALPVKVETLPVKVEMLPEVNMEALITKAIEQNSALEVLDRLCGMRDKLKAEVAREAYFGALARFQSECPTIKKTKQVKDKNSKPRYKYAPLEVIVEAVREPLEKHGFSYTIQTEQSEGSVTATCIAHHAGGHSESSTFTIPIDKDAYMNDAQKTASAMTYAKRYSFCNAFGIMTGDEDDDAKGTDPAHTAGNDTRTKPKAASAKSAPAAAGSGTQKRTPQQHLNSIKMHYKLFEDAHDIERASTELINASEFEKTDRKTGEKTGEMAKGYETPEVIEGKIKEYGINSCAARLRVICHKLETAWKKEMKNEGKGGL